MRITLRIIRHELLEVVVMVDKWEMILKMTGRDGSQQPKTFRKWKRPVYWIQVVPWMMPIMHPTTWHWIILKTMDQCYVNVRPAWQPISLCKMSYYKWIWNYYHWMGSVCVNWRIGWHDVVLVIRCIPTLIRTTSWVRWGNVCFVKNVAVM